MAALGNLQIDCSCGDTLSVPVAVEPVGYASMTSVDGREPNSITATLRIDHAFIAAHMAGHDNDG